MHFVRRCDDIWGATRMQGMFVQARCIARPNSSESNAITVLRMFPLAVADACRAWRQVRYFAGPTSPVAACQADRVPFEED